MTWLSADPPPDPLIPWHAWPRILLRLLALILLLLVSVMLHGVLRLVEAAIFAGQPRLSAALTQAVCRAALIILRLSLHSDGMPVTGQAVIVANHSSWLDIFVLNSAMQVCFVSKAEVAGWPGIGFLARITGTVFIRRDRHAAARHTQVLAERLHAGTRLLFFPEGTSSDGLRVLPFKTTLFQVLLVPELRGQFVVQPVSVTYRPPKAFDPRALGWWGGMEFGRHLLQVLAMPRAGQVRLVFHPAIPVTEATDRKTLAQRCETAVRAGFGWPDQDA